MGCMIGNNKYAKPVIMLIIATLFLLQNYAVIDVFSGLNLAQNWPVILIIVAIIKIAKGGCKK